MYRIGDFSKITQLSVRTLRYYDEIQLLSPSLRDENTHYRYYDEADFQRAQMIKLLRNLSFSIMEIQDILATIHEPTDLTYYIKEKQEFVRQEIKEKEALIHQMEQFLHPLSQKASQRPYEIKQVEVPEVLVAAFRYRGSYQEMSSYLPKLYQEIKGAGSKEAPFNLYYDESFEEQADIEICIPIKKRFVHKLCTIKSLAPVVGLSTIHTGSYDTLCLAYKVLLDEANARGYHLLTPSRECYLKGPGKIFKGNPNTYQTQIILPYEEENDHE